MTPNARRALAEYRGSLQTTAGGDDPLLARVEASIAAGAHDVLWDELQPSPRAAASRWSHRFLWAGVGAAAAAVVFWGGLQFAGIPLTPAMQTSSEAAAYDRSSGRESSPVNEAPALVSDGDARARPLGPASSRVVAPAPATAPAPSVVVAPPAVVPRSPAGATARDVAKLKPSAARATLAEELRLMQSARAALLRDDPNAALATLRSHALRFGDGQLREDRRALLVVAHCRAGEHDAGLKAKRSFVIDYPSSHHTAQVTAACNKEKPSAP